MMSSSAVRWTLTVIYCSLIAYCNAGRNITAYVKLYLPTTTCETVPQIRTVCNIDWKLRDTDAELYDDWIQAINATVSSNEIYRGLSPGDALHCRKMYENMQCRNAFPVCDWKRMVVDHGNAKARCEYAKQACTTISIEGCEFSTSGVEAIIPEQKKCEPIAANTSKLCPDTLLKVPKQYNVFAAGMVEPLLTIADKFAEEMKNHTNMGESCEMKYREVLCRLNYACSPDELYYLQYINKEECEEMISCVKSAGFSHEITSVCAHIPSTEDLESLTVRNPYVGEKVVFSTTPETPSTTPPTTKPDNSTKKISISTEDVSEPTKETHSTTPTTKPDHSTKKISISTEDVSEPTKERERVATSETLITEPSEKRNKINNTIAKVKKPHGGGNPSGNYQNLPLFTMAVAMLVSLAAHLLP